MTEMTAPLREDERYLHLFLDADEAVGQISESQIRLTALTETLRRAAAAGLEVTRGPEIVEYHRAQYPGDQFWVTTIAVGRPLV